MAYARNLGEIRVLIASRKRWDLVFACVGVLALMIGLLTFAALFAMTLVMNIVSIRLVRKYREVYE